MSSFFTVPGDKKRKRPVAPEIPKKRIAANKQPAKKPSRTAPPAKLPRPTKRREVESESDEISSSESDGEGSAGRASTPEKNDDESGSEGEGETAAERRLRLAERYLDNVKEQVDNVYGFDAEEIDRDLIAERLQEDVAESKGKVYRTIASQFAIDQASHTFFKCNSHSFTAIAVHAPFAYTTSKDMLLQKWRIQELPKDQWPQTTRKKPKKPPAPPRKKPELEKWIKGSLAQAQSKEFKRHVDQILCVAASPDGKYVVTGGADKRLIVYDAESLKPLRVFPHHRDAVTSVAFRRGTNQLYSCSRDKTVKVWNIEAMAYVETLFGHQSHVVDIDALAQDRCVTVGSRDRTARLWKVAEETQLVFRGGGAADKKNAPPLPEDASPEEKRARAAHEGSMDRVAMIDDDLFVTGSDNGAITLWSLQKKKPLYTVPLAHGAEQPPRPEEASAEKHPGKEVIPPPIPRWITALKTIPYSDVIFSGSWDGYVRMWRLSEDKRRIEPVGTLGAPDQHVANGISPLPNGVLNGILRKHRRKQQDEAPWEIKGVINDIGVFERGERGEDGICVVAAVGKEHRLGRWKMASGGRNGGVVFEVPRKPPANGTLAAKSDDEDEE